MVKQHRTGVVGNQRATAKPLVAPSRVESRESLADLRAAARAGGAGWGKWRESGSGSHAQTAETTLERQLIAQAQAPARRVFHPGAIKCASQDVRLGPARRLATLWTSAWCWVREDQELRAGGCVFFYGLLAISTADEVAPDERLPEPAWERN